MAIARNLANSIINEVLGGVANSVPSTWYFGLCTTEPQSDGTILDEPTVAGYARTAIANNKTNFSGATYNGEHPLAFITNATKIQMSEIMDGNEPVVNYFFLSNVETGGTAYMWGKFDRPRTLMINSTLRVEPNGAVFEIANA